MFLNLREQSIRNDKKKYFFSYVQVFILLLQLKNLLPLINLKQKPKPKTFYYNCIFEINWNWHFCYMLYCCCRVVFKNYFIKNILLSEHLERIFYFSKYVFNNLNNILTCNWRRRAKIIIRCKPIRPFLGMQSFYSFSNPLLFARLKKSTFLQP